MFYAASIPSNYSSPRMTLSITAKPNPPNATRCSSHHCARRLLARQIGGTRGRNTDGARGVLVKTVNVVGGRLN